MINAIVPQFIRHDFPGFTTKPPQQTPEEAFSSSHISLGLKVHIDNFTILIHGSPQVMLFSIDFDEDFIDIESVAIASVLSFQSAGV